MFLQMSLEPQISELGAHFKINIKIWYGMFIL